MSTMTYSGTLEVIACCAWGIDFGMPPEVYRARRRDHGTFWCPQGHSQHFTARSEAQLLEEERQRVQRLRSLLTDERDQHRRTERRLSAPAAS